MAAQAKYLFDQDFAAGANPAEKPIAPAELAIKLAEAESKGFRDGFAAAETEGTAVAARRMAIAFEQIGDALDRLARGLGAVELRLETEAVELAAAIARKLAPELVSREPFAEIAALATECLKQLAARAACGGARQRRAARQGPRASSTRSPTPAASAAASWCWPSPRSRSATARSNGPTAASSATRPRPTIAIGNAIARFLGARQPPPCQSPAPSSQTISQETHHE